MPIDRGSTELYALFVAYLDRFALTCPGYLPTNKVPLTAYFCAVVQTPVNKYGGRAGMDSCSQPSRRPIPGEYAYPEDEAASVQLENAMRTSLFASVFKNLQKDNDARKAIDVTTKAVIDSDDAGRDMTTLFAHNACSSLALNRLRTNMRLYAQGQQAISLADQDVSPTRGGNAEAYFRHGMSLMENSTVDPKTFKIVPAPGCVEAFRSYLMMSPDGPHAAKAKEYLTDLGEKVN